MQKKYPVVTLCGSTRFKNEFMETQKRLTLEGNIVISVGLFGHAGDKEVWENMDEGTLTKTKEMLDDMHKRKIDMADEIMVIDVDGYIGESTESEIEYAKSQGKFISFYNHPEAHYDDIGGFHDSGMGWNPNGSWCGECSKLSCRECPNIKLKEEDKCL